MSLRILETGVSAVQAGNKAEGARLLRIAVKSGELSGEVAAIAYLWLAETTDDPAQKRAYYNNALSADPSNTDARQRLAGLLSAQLPRQNTNASAPPNAYPQPRGAPPSIAASGQVAAVIGGPNGPGSAFFVTTDGLLATTRYVVGGLERVMVEMPGARQVLGQVVRSFPEIDVALIRTDERVPDVLPISPYPRVPDEATLIVGVANSPTMRGKQRPTKRVIAAHWIPTDLIKLPDAGGNPLLDEQNYLVGMMTRNSSRASGYLYGVHITAVRHCTDQYLQEVRGERRAYCPNCGCQSRATASGYFYCEACGSVAPQAHQLNRQPQGDPYAEVSRIRCTQCGAQVGYHNGHCLRCGQVPATQPLT